VGDDRDPNGRAYSSREGGRGLNGDLQAIEKNGSDEKGTAEALVGDVTGEPEDGPVGDAGDRVATGDELPGFVQGQAEPGEDGHGEEKTEDAEGKRQGRIEDEEGLFHEGDFSRPTLASKGASLGQFTLTTSKTNRRGRAAC